MPRCFYLPAALQTGCSLLTMVTLACGILLTGTGKACAQQPTWKFIAFGDSLSLNISIPVNTNILSELASEVAGHQPDFLLFLGDFSLHDTEPEFALWTNAMAPVLDAGIPIYPVIGNHDTASLAVSSISNLCHRWLPNNGPPGEESSTFAVIHKNALLVCLNQFALGNEYRVNQPWLNRVLATNTLPHLFVAGHMPAFKLYHGDCLAAFPRERDVFWHSLSNAGARVYFTGHDHFYDHARLDDGDGSPGNDIHQIIVGTGGAPLYVNDAFNGDNGAWTPERMYHEGQHGYVVVEVTGADVRSTWYNRTGEGVYGVTAETFSYSVEPRPVLRAISSPGSLTLLWSGSGTLQSAPFPSGPFKEVEAAVSPWVISTASGSQRFFRLAVP